MKPEEWPEWQKALYRAAVQSYAELNLKGSMGKAWKEIRKPHILNCTYDNARRCEFELTQSRVEAIAKIAVGQGYMGFRWLEEWLTVTGHPDARRFITELFPPNRRIQQANLQIPPRHNLPARRFEHRESPSRVLHHLCADLERQTAVVVLSGEDGLGKSRALEDTAWYYVNTKPDRFRTIVWIQLPVREGKLKDLLDQILWTNNVTHTIDLTLHQKRQKVGELLADRATLIVIDHIDRYQNADEFLDWLQYLPAGCKALVSMREQPQRIINCSVYRRLNPLDPKDFPAEFQAFVSEFLREFNITEDEMHHIWAVVHGNPRKMRLVATYARAAKQQHNVLQFSNLSLKDLVQKTCSVLTDAAREVLMGIIPFPLCANLEPLRQVANPLLSEDAFRTAVDELVNLDLVDVTYDALGNRVKLQWDETLQIVASEMIPAPHRGEQIYQRWVETYCRLAEAVGFCAKDHNRLRILDPEMDVLPLVIDYVSGRKGFEQEAIRLANCTYFYFVRGYWSKRNNPHLVAALAAREIEVKDIELYHLCYTVEWLTKRGNIKEIDEQRYLARMDELSTHSSITLRTRVNYLNTRAYYLIMADESYKEAEEILQKVVDEVPANAPQKFLAKYRLGFCYSKMPEHADRALDFLIHAAQEADDNAESRIAVSMRILQADILLQQAATPNKEGNRLTGVRSLLDKLSDIVREIDDRTQYARYLKIRGRYQVLRGYTGQGLQDLHKAQELFYQLARPGLAAEVQELIKDILDTQNVADRTQNNPSHQTTRI